MRTSVLVALSLSTAVVAALPAMAQERSFNFSLRGGVGAVPDYPGSDNYGAQPNLGFTFGSLKWGRINAGTGIGAVPNNGLAFRGALRFQRSRDVADNPELAGLGDIDASVELGFGVVYRQANWQVFGDVRQGFGGHHGVTGTLGADVIFRPSDRLTITAGPRVNLGDSEYTTTYFGITPAQSAASTFAVFDANGGVLGAGLTVEATYELDDVWAVEGLIGYEKLLNDAANSPITQAGSEDQWTVRIGLSRAFTLRF